MEFTNDVSVTYHLIKNMSYLQHSFFKAVMTYSSCNFYHIITVCNETWAIQKVIQYYYFNSNAHLIKLQNDSKFVFH